MKTKVKIDLIKIVKAVYLNNYKLELSFNDGTIQVINPDEFLKKTLLVICMKGKLFKQKT